MTSAERRDRPRAVLDSNVLISAFAFPSGVPYRIVQALIGVQFVGVISPFILEEVTRNLRRLDVDEGVVDATVEFLSETCEVIDPSRHSNVPSLTKADNRILDCAISGHADYLVTGDKGILALGRHAGIRIIGPAEFSNAELRQFP